jgi:hypothetical protein
MRTELPLTRTIVIVISSPTRICSSVLLVSTNMASSLSSVIVHTGWVEAAENRMGSASRPFPEQRDTSGITFDRRPRPTVAAAVGEPRKSPASRCRRRTGPRFARPALRTSPGCSNRAESCGLGGNRTEVIAAKQLAPAMLSQDGRGGTVQNYNSLPLRPPISKPSNAAGRFRRGAGRPTRTARWRPLRPNARRACGRAGSARGSNS